MEQDDDYNLDAHPGASYVDPLTGAAGLSVGKFGGWVDGSSFVPGGGVGEVGEVGGLEGLGMGGLRGVGMGGGMGGEAGEGEGGDESIRGGDARGEQEGQGADADDDAEGEPDPGVGGSITGSTQEPPAPSIAPAPAAATAAADAAAAKALKRRRGPGVVTANACTECRKKRSKCDGAKPRCGRCRAQLVRECVYEVPLRQSKETLRSHIGDLHERQRLIDQVLDALRSAELADEVARRFRLGQSVDDIYAWLENPQKQEQQERQLQQQLQQQQELLQQQQQQLLEHQLHHSQGMLPPLSAMNHSSSPFPNAAGPGSLEAMNLRISPISAHTPTQMLGAAWPLAGPPHPLGQADFHDPSTSGLMPMPMPMPMDVPMSMSMPMSTPVPVPMPMPWGPEADMTHLGPAGSWAAGMDVDPPDGGHISGGLEEVLAPAVTAPVKPPASSWTDVTDDSNLVQHLLALYFCWEYPTFASLSKEHFLRDFQDGRQRYCSKMLVNALLALGCRFSTQPSTREVPDDPYTSGNHFFKESQRLLHDEPDHHTLTTIQALGIMSIREASCGRDSESWYYAGQSIRLAIEMGLHRIPGGDETEETDETAVQSATFWGAFALDHAWSLATGSLPQCSCFPRLPSKPSLVTDIESSLWVPYTDDGAPLRRSCEQLSNVRSVYRCFCELSELVHRSLYILHAPGRPLSSRDLLYIYTKYLNWYDSIPTVLRLGQNFTPAVLFAHMYYHFAILLLFRPLIKLRIVGSNVVPRDVCLQAADAIQGLLRSYAQLYTLQRTPSFVPYFVLTSSIMHLAISATIAQGNGPNTPSDPTMPSDPGPSGTTAPAPAPVPDLGPRVSAAISQAIADLTEMAPCHHFAEQALNILRYLAGKWELDVDFDQSVRRGAGDIRRQNPSLFGGAGPHLVSQTGAVQGTTVAGFSKDSVDLEIDYGRLVRPRTTSLNFFAPNIGQHDLVSTLSRDTPILPPQTTTTTTTTTDPPGLGMHNNHILLPQAQAQIPPLEFGDGDVFMTEDDPGLALGPGDGGVGDVGHQVKAVDSMDNNPLFWPFPLQGRPIFPDSEGLEEAGFAFL